MITLGDILLGIDSGFEEMTDETEIATTAMNHNCLAICCSGSNNTGGGIVYPTSMGACK